LLPVISQGGRNVRKWYDSAVLAIAAVKRDCSVAAVIAGLIAVTVSYAGPLLIVFQAAKAVQLSDAQLSSWIWAISFGSGLTGLILSMSFRAPVIIAWSTPGAVLLVSGWAAYTFSDSIGAFVLSAVIITALGFSGLFSGIMKRVPQSIIAAMLAGILLKFGVEVFVALKQLPILASPMILSYLLAKRLYPRYAVAVTLFVGLIAAYNLHALSFEHVSVGLVQPVFTLPTFSLEALLGLGIPLCIVTMVSQNATGIGVLRVDGFNTPANPLITATGIASLLTAPFGSHGINLAAITAAICTGKEAHPDFDKRYIAGIACGLFYMLVSIFGATIVSVFSALPNELVAVISGVALFGSLSASLSAAMKEEQQRESGLITFLVTISGITLAGIGAPFWGLVAGIITDGILNGRIGGLLKRLVTVKP
jgi:benzoate membrane transport protein